MTKILDQNMAVKKADIDGIKFYSPDAEEFSLEGFAWRKAGMPFDRFAGYNTAGFRDALINLAKYPAEVNLRFISNSKRIVIRAAFRQVHKIARMALTGSMGFDVYVRDQGEMVFRGVTSFDFDAMDYCVDLFSDSKQKMRQFLINFPLYGDIESLEIGLENEAEIKKAHAWKDSRPLICYGTSILHGACANRPGMAYPAILSRTLDRPVMNFGFAGNARGDAYMAEMLASIKAPCCYILDYDPNSSWENTRTTAENFIGILRKKHSEVPIVFVSNIFQFDRHYTEVFNSESKIFLF